MGETVFGILEQLKKNQITQEEANRKMEELRSKTSGSAINSLNTANSSSAPAVSGEASVDYVINKIKFIFTDLLKISEDEFDVDEELREYGIESYLQVKIVDAINEIFSINCMATVFFELKQQTIMGLAEYIIENYNISAPVESDSVILNNLTETQGEISAADVDIHIEAEAYEKDDDVAVIGIDIKAPDSDDIFEFWKKLLNNEDCISDMPNNMVAESTNGSNVIKRGGFVKDIEMFDHDLFRISNREAIYMDPQQRLTLESVYRLFEDAGYRISDFSESNTGVFIAAATHDYIDLLHKYYPDSYEAHFSTGTSNSMIANRVSFVYNFHGPSEVVDTACSGSLVSIHRAVQAIKSKECDIAVAGGVNLNLSVSTFDIFQKAGMLSKDGKCKTLSNTADGYVRGEGVGTILLKSLKKAIEDNDNIYGIIKGSAVNHGGKANSLTAPNINAQADVIMRAVKNSGVDISSVSYIELHGTGTNLGDPAEINGLKKAYRELCNQSGKVLPKISCGIGSVKTNIGHLESAAGVAGLIKVLLSLKNNCLPAIINYSALNPIISLDDTPFYVVEKNISWEKKEDKNGRLVPRCAGISSFGFGGTNAHIVVEEYISSDNSNEIGNFVTGDKVYVLSAGDIDVLEEYIRNFISFIDENRSVNLYDLAYTLYTGRERLNKRIAIIASDLSDLRSKMEKWLDDKSFCAGVYTNCHDNAIPLSQINDNIYKAAYAFVYESPLGTDEVFEVKGRHISAPYYPFKRTVCWPDSIPKRVRNASDDGSIMKLSLNTEIEVNNIFDDSQIISLSPLNNNETGEIVLENDKITLSCTDSAPSTLISVDGSVKSEIKKILAEVLYVNEDKLPCNQNFIDIGLDSILCVEFIDKLNHKFNSHYSAVITYDYSTIDKLSEYLSGNNMPAQRSVVAVEKTDDDDRKVTINVPEKTTLKKICSEVLIKPENEIDDTLPFSEMGMDSILCVEFVEKINISFGLKITTDVIYDCVCIDSLYKEIVSRCSGNKNQNIPEEYSTANKIESPDSELISDIKTDDIAVIGISLRTADASNQEQFWRNIRNGRNSVDVIPEERWNIGEYYDPDMTKSGKMYCKYGAFLKDADCFDSSFFNISPAEAREMDPSHRILMEEIYKSLDDAGYTSEDLDGMKCSLYTGISTGGEYPVKTLLNNHSIACARIPYFLNLRGEAISLDTACSSSLTALTLACRSIWSNSSDMAIAAGVSLFLEPEGYIQMCKSGMLSRSGKCSTFDDFADGFIPGEAVASVVVKSASKAIADGDNIYGIIKGISMNQDGKTNGITAPSAESQASLEKSVYTQAKIDPVSIEYIECHGTGTKLGDPIEIAGLTHSFDAYTDKKQFCKIGSVKTNVGHTACAAGLVSLIKVLLSMKNNEIPPSLNYSIQNEHINLKDTPFVVNNTLSEWSDKKKKRAAVSSFGMGGTNVHVVIDSYEKNHSSKTVLPYSPILISAKSDDALKNRIKRMYEWLDSNRADISEVAYNLACHKTHFNVRVGIVASDADDLKNKLREIISSFDSYEFSHTEAKERRYIDSINNVFEIYGAETLKKCLESLCKRYMQGEEIDWRSIYKDCKFSKISVPGYEFEQRHFPIYKIEEGSKVSVGKKQISYRIDKNTSFIHDNIAYGTNVMPIMSYLEYIRKAVKSLFGKDISCITDLRAYNFLLLDSEKEIQVEIEKRNDGYNFAVYSGESKTLHIKGIASDCSSTEKKIDISELKSTHKEIISGESILDRYSKLKHFSGKSLRALYEAAYTENHASCLARIKLPSEVHSTLKDYFFHPSLLEGVIQAIGASLNQDKHTFNEKYLSCGFDRLYLSENMPESFYVYSHEAMEKDKMILESGILIKEDGTVFGEIKNFMIKNTGQAYIQKNTDYKLKLCSGIQSMLSALLECENINRNELLSQYGFSSLSLIDLAKMIGDELNISMNAELLMSIDDITVNKIADVVYSNYSNAVNNAYSEDESRIEMPVEIFNDCENADEAVHTSEVTTKCDVAVIGLYTSSERESSVDENKCHSIDRVLSVVDNLLGDAAYTKNSLCEKKVGVIAVNTDPENNKFCGEDNRSLKNIAHEISRSFGFSGISETIIASDKTEIAAVDFGAEFVRYGKCDICICISYSDNGITAVMLRNYDDSVKEHDNIYCVIDNTNVEFLSIADDTDNGEGKIGQFVRYSDLIEYIHSGMKSNTNVNVNPKDNDSVFNVFSDSDGKLIIKMRNDCDSVNMTVRAVSKISKQTKDNEEIILFSAESKEKLLVYIEDIISFIRKQAVCTERNSILNTFDKDAFSLISEELKYLDGEYTAESMESAVNRLNEIYSLNISVEELTKASSIGQFLHNVYVSEKSKIKEYYLDAGCLGQTFNVALSDIAYTLRVGRDEQNYRIAFTANNVSEFYKIISDWHKKGKSDEIFENDLNVNNIERYNLFEGEEGDKMINYLVEACHLGYIGKMWTFGVPVDWSKLGSGDNGYRIPLPFQKS